MADSNHIQDPETRFSSTIPVVRVSRVQFDVVDPAMSNLPNGSTGDQAAPRFFGANANFRHPPLSPRLLFPQDENNPSAPNASTTLPEEVAPAEQQLNTSKRRRITTTTRPRGASAAATRGTRGGGKVAASSRARVKRFHASADLYLHLDPKVAPPTTTPKLLGRITKCPTKKNNNEYVVEWEFTATEGLVVNCVSSYMDFSITSSFRQVGSEKVAFPCPSRGCCCIFIIKMVRGCCCCSSICTLSCA